jgi:branched-chain amino acid transport system substrate-binding protein
VAVLSLALVAGACSKKTNTGTGTTSSSTCSSNPTLSALGAGASGVEAAGVVRPAQTRAMSSLPTIRIGFIGDLTGSNSALVVPGEDAATLAIEQANAKGDLPVHLELAPKDNKEALPTTAPGLAQQLINDHTVVAVIGPAFSGETSAVQPLFAAAGLTHITQSATRDDLTSHGYQTFFRGVASNAGEASAVSRVIAKLGCKTAAVIDDKSAFGQDLGQTAANLLPTKGVQVIDRESIAPATDYTSLVDTLVTKKPDVVFYGGYEPQASIIIKQMRQRGVKSLFAGGDGIKDVKLAPDAGTANAAGTIAVAPAIDPNTSSDPADVKFVSDYKARWHVAPDIYAPEAYDIANIFIAAIKDCGKTGASGITRSCVLTFVKSLSGFKGLTKTFGWTTDPHALHEVTDQFVNVFQVQNGQLKLVGDINKVAP